MNRLLSTLTAVGLACMAMLLFGLIASGGISPTQAQTLLEVTTVPDLIVDIQAHQETVPADSVITYTILYTNTLNRSLADVSVVATVMSRQTFSGDYLSSPLIPGGNFSYTGNYTVGYQLAWSLGTVPAYQNGSLQITTTVPAAAEPQWDDRLRWPMLGASAAIATSTTDVTVGNPQGLEADSVSVMVVGPILRIAKAGSASGVRPGALLTYTLTLQNKVREDSTPATGLIITDTVPDNVTFVSADSGGAFVPEAGSTGSVVWRPEQSLAPGETLTVRFTVRAVIPASCPPARVFNGKGTYSVSSSETLRTVTGANDVATSVLDVLTKVIQTPPVPKDSKQVFPGDIVTYTITIYNPYHDRALTGLRLTDTLPGTLERFAFLGMVSGPAPVVTPPTLVWENLTVSAGGTLVLSFQVRVPRQIPFGNNSSSLSFDNNLSATAPDIMICPMADKTPSRAVVVPQLWMEKSVVPTHVQSGGIVTYTITVANRGLTPISNVRLTDTLPAIVTDGSQFRFLDMITGPEPVPGHPQHLVVWENLTMPANSNTVLIFRANAIGWPLKQYTNALAATSPETSIPPRTGRAPVLIDSPLAIAKSVNPTAVFVEGIVTYNVSVCNVATGTYTISRFSDALPTGFYETVTGSQAYEFGISPAAVLQPGQCWLHQFNVRVSLGVGCDKTIKNGAMTVQMIAPVNVAVIQPAGTAALRIDPHVTLQKIADHSAVLPGETVIYTVTVTNASPRSIPNVTVEDLLPAGFDYVSMVAGPNPTSVTGNRILWENQTLAASSQYLYVLRTRVTSDHALGTFKNDVNASTSELVCIKDFSPGADVRVVEEIVELSKKVVPTSIAPFGIVEYQLLVKNLDTYPIPNFTITETLPGAALPPHFEFITMTLGPAPIEIQGRQVVWRNLTIPGNKQTLTLKFQVRGAILLGTYTNQVTAWCPRSQAIERSTAWDTSAPVTILPGIVMYKTVHPTETTGLAPVVYSVTLYNNSSSVLRSVRITDTLPAGFTYRTMRQGALPVQISGDTVVWQIAEIGKNQAADLVFEAHVGASVITGTYYNKLTATSPSALIPGMEGAPVYVEPGERWGTYLPLVLRAHTDQ